MSVFSGLAGRVPRTLPAPRDLPSRYRWVNAFLAAAVIGLGVGAYFTVNSSSTPAAQASIRTAPVPREESFSRPSRRRGTSRRRRS